MTTKDHSRIVIVSNRLPFNVGVEGNELRYLPSTGGLVTGLGSYLDLQQRTGREYLWVGWPGASVDEPLREKLKAEAFHSYNSVPVFLSAEEMERFYLGFCNKTIWPLFHYFPSYAAYEEQFWDEYVHVNKNFCETILATLKEGDTVWVHDYHLMLLPRLLKEQAPDVPVGFFLHIPFPSFEVFRLLPGRWRSELLAGLLGADLIGFHAYDYAQHFLQTVLRVMGHDHSMGQILTSERVVRVDTFPMGIDFDKFSRAGDETETQKEQQVLRESLQNMRVILSVDRLDYSKGILNRLQGFEVLLEKHPEYHGTVVLVMVVVPSRIGVDQYALMKKKIEELIGNINGRFGRIGWSPVVYQYRQAEFHELAALYRASNICLVTPLRDGMNLVAKEYVASRSQGTGVLILSEMAGAAKELAEAIIINPNNRTEVAAAMKEALEIPPEEQQRRMTIMRNRLQRYTVTRWADDFIHELLAMREVQRRFGAKLLPVAMRRRMIDLYREGVSRLILLDYDGTLAPFARRPDLARPTSTLKTLLRNLASDPNNSVVIVSGRDRKTLTDWLGDLPVGLVAEHGAWLRFPGDSWKVLRPQKNAWKEKLLPVLEQYADRVPGTFVEEKDHSLVWHFRNADPEQAKGVASELTEHLVSFTASIDVHVLRGNKVVELRTAGIDKGTAVLEWLNARTYDFVLAMGDDWTDEDMFKAVPETAITIKVGVANTSARFNLRNTSDALKILDQLAHSALSIRTGHAGTGRDDYRSSVDRQLLS